MSHTGHCLEFTTLLSSVISKKQKEYFCNFPFTFSEQSWSEVTKFAQQKQGYGETTTVLTKIGVLLKRVFFWWVTYSLQPKFSHPPHGQRKSCLQLWGYSSLSNCLTCPDIGTWNSASLWRAVGYSQWRGRGRWHQPIRSIVSARETMHFWWGCGLENGFLTKLSFDGSGMDRHGTSAVFKIMSPDPFPVLCIPERSSP